VKSTPSYVILFLALTTLGGAALAWRQYQELAELRAAAMNRQERADLMKRIWDLEKANRDLADQAGAFRTYQELDDMLAIAEERPDEEREGRSSRGGRGGRGEGGRGGPPIQIAALRELVNKPEVQAMIGFQQRAAIEANYGPLFKSLNLSSEQAEKLKAVLADRQTTLQDVYAAAREQGISPREHPEAFRKLISDAQNEINNSIKGVIGEAGFAQLQTYEQTLPQRNLVNELQQRLSYTTTPLTPAQAEQLVQILAANAPPRTTTTGTSGTLQPSMPGSSGRGGYSMSGLPSGFGGGYSGGPGRSDFGMVGAALGGPGGAMVGSVLDGRSASRTAPITPNALNQAQGVLAQPQLSALQQIYQQQQNQQQIQQLIRETLVAHQPQGSSGSPPATGPGGSSSPASPNSGAAPSPSRRPRGGG
jgi:hypothetical protein